MSSATSYGWLIIMLLEASRSVIGVRFSFQLSWGQIYGHSVYFETTIHVLSPRSSSFEQTSYTVYDNSQFHGMARDLFQISYRKCSRFLVFDVSKQTKMRNKLFPGQCL